MRRGTMDPPTYVVEPPSPVPSPVPSPFLDIKHKQSRSSESYYSDL
jgi:hypothetical protein